MSKTRSGKLFIVSAPSGAGKTTLVKSVLNYFPHEPLERVVTYTTKSPRSIEIPGIDYHFISDKEFEQKIQEEFFLEHSKAYGNYYGSPKTVLSEMHEGSSRILILDQVGTKHVKNVYDQAIAIWIMPPSFEELEMRLLQRKTETKEQQKTRLLLAQQEINTYYIEKFFDYTIVNNRIDEALNQLIEIIRVELIKKS